VAITALEQAFINHYNGDSMEAAKKAGWKGLTEAGYREVIRKMLANPDIRDALAEKMEFDREILESRIRAEREIRRNFWRDVMVGDQYDMRDRIKCSELLGKADGDFIERKELSGPGGGPIQSQQLIFKWQ